MSAALNKSSAHFYRVSGPDMLARTEPYLRWQNARLETDLWPYSRILAAAPGATTDALDEAGNRESGINFASQDYLSLSRHPGVLEAGVRAIRDFGVHSAGSPMLMGNTTLSVALENEIAELVETEHVLLFPSGWGAGFGAIAALVRPDDHIILDHLAHACLQQGAHAATQNVVRHEHLDIDSITAHLRAIRSRDSKNGIMVVTEGLFSMDSDSPDLSRLQSLLREFSATRLVDVAHDLGALGRGGGGQIAIQKMIGKLDLVVGAFSKTFASNGGFVATHSSAVRQYIKVYGGPHIFSNALSPVQAAVVMETLRIVRSSEGNALREQLMTNILALRNGFAARGVECVGEPSPIVPVPIGSEKVGRMASGLLFRHGIFANLVEFPAVAIGSARFRMQAMAGHAPEHSRAGVEGVVGSIAAAKRFFAEQDPVFAVVQQRNGAHS
jgi:7-keto-8-aminopelargonate synthetase-like enzyme